MAKTLTLEVGRMGTVSVRPGRETQDKTSTKKVTIVKRVAENIWIAKIRDKTYGLFRHRGDPEWTIESRDPMQKAVKWVVLDTIKDSDLPQKIEARTRRVRAEEGAPEKGPKGTPYKDQMPGGIGDEKAPSDFDQDQLKKGVKVELEHTDDPLTALEISVDHLTENPQYYDLLEKIEGPGAHDSESGFGLGPGGGRGLGPGGGDPSKCPFRAISEDGHADEIVRFLREHPEPDDEQLHQLAEQLGVEPPDLEEEVYRLLARLLAVRPKGADGRIFIEGDDPADLLAELALSLYERGDDVLGDAVADVYAAWR